MRSDDSAGAEASEEARPLAESLQSLRREAGGVSYAEIASRIAALRAKRSGGPRVEVSRATVYDAFRPGRTRLNPELVVDIALSLGVDEAEAELWRRRCAATPPALARPRTPGSAEPVRTDQTRPLPARGHHQFEARPPHPLRAPATASVGMPKARDPRGWRLLLLLACIALNLTGIVVVQALRLPIYLDMVGTATAAMALGPWPGAVVALSSNLLGFTVGAPGAAPFALVNVAGALVWGYGMRLWRMGDDIGRFFTLNVAAAVACSLVGAPLNVILFGGLSGHGSDVVVGSFAQLGVPLMAAAFSANILTSLIDKVLTGFIALMILIRLDQTRRLPALPIGVVRQLSGPTRPRRRSRRRLRAASLSPRTQE